jgi:hypothetical protein
MLYKKQGAMPLVLKIFKIYYTFLPSPLRRGDGGEVIVF